MSVRLSQLLVAIVLGLAALALFRTVSAYAQAAAINDLRMRGAAIADRETQRLGDRIAVIESLAATTALDAHGFDPRRFERAAQTMMERDQSIEVIDFFNARDVHIAHVAAHGPDRLGAPGPADKARISRLEIQTIELAMFDAELSRATSVADVPATAPDGRSAAMHGPIVTRAHFYLATQVVEHGDLGTIVEYLDARRLIVDDIASQTTNAFALDDGHGRNLQTASLLTPASERLTFAIPFADRVLQLVVAMPARRPSNPWLFLLGWLALTFAIVLPMEVVGQINKRVQALNEELEMRVAERTQELERSLRESRRLAAVVESVHEGVMAVDGHAIIRYANDALCAELRVGPQELIDKPIAQVAELALCAAVLAEISAAVSATGFVYREMERTRADGTTYTAGVTFTRHGIENGNTLIAVSRDVTDRRRLVDELLEAKARLERETRARADFIATASHELRTPVTTLRTLAALLLEKLGVSPQPPDNSKLLGILDHESRRLTHLVEDLLKIAKIDALDAALSDQPVDLCAVVGSEIDEVLRLATPGPALELHVDSRPVWVRGDEDALRSIVHNLVSNARKFTPPAGRVEVRVAQDKRRARIAVADTGMGIAAADLPHIFERFYRAQGTAAKAPGAGLGLAIVARLVELMHGTISVASEVGHGTTITVEFPLAEPVPGPATAASR